jgi:hypothetical protein
MRDIRLALREFLLSDPDIVTIVGDRIYPIKIPQGVSASCIVYTRISDVGDYHLAGPSGIAGPRIQIDAWAVSANKSVTLANLVKTKIDGFRGVMGTGDNAVKVLGVFVADMREDYDDAAKLFRSGRDFFLHHIEL